MKSWSISFSEVDFSVFHDKSNVFENIRENIFQVTFDDDHIGPRYLSACSDAVFVRFGMPASISDSAT